MPTGPLFNPQGIRMRSPGTFASSVLCLVSGLTRPSDRLLNCLSIRKERVGKTEPRLGDR